MHSEKNIQPFFWEYLQNNSVVDHIYVSLWFSYNTDHVFHIVDRKTWNSYFKDILYSEISEWKRIIIMPEDMNTVEFLDIMYAMVSQKYWTNNIPPDHPIFFLLKGVKTSCVEMKHFFKIIQEEVPNIVTENLKYFSHAVRHQLDHIKVSKDMLAYIDYPDIFTGETQDQISKIYNYFQEKIDFLLSQHHILFLQWSLLKENQIDETKHLSLARHYLHRNDYNQALITLESWQYMFPHSINLSNYKKEIIKKFHLNKKFNDPHYIQEAEYKKQQVLENLEYLEGNILDMYAWKEVEMYCTYLHHPLLEKIMILQEIIPSQASWLEWYKKSHITKPHKETSESYTSILNAPEREFQSFVICLLASQQIPRLINIIKYIFLHYGRDTQTNF